MKAFLIGLQFLTRIKLVRQEIWEDKDFGASVSWFPLVGAVIGAVLLLLAWLLFGRVSMFMLGTILVIAEFLLTGGLHADGLMDTCDGYFSGRDRERSLAIMKDSRVGSNGVVGFVFLVLLKISVYASLSEFLWVGVFAAPLLGRWLMTYTITRFPYARPQGIGKAFAAFAPSYAIWLATGLAIIPLFYFQLPYLVMAITGFLWMQFVNHSFVRKLGGVTGDTYGAMTETSELIMLLSLMMLETMKWS